MKTELIKNEKMGIYAPLLGPEEMRAMTERKCSGVGVREGSVPYGVLTYYKMPSPDGKKGDVFFIDHYYVHPDSRRQGIFSDLLDMVKTVCKNQKIKGIVVQTVEPGMDETVAALKAMGFKKMIDGNQVYKFDLAGADRIPIMSYDTAKHDMRAVSLAGLAPSRRKAFLDSFKKRFPKELGPAAAGGPLLNDYSYVYVVGGDVKAFLLSSSFRKDEIYLSSLLVTPKYRHAAIILLKKFLGDLVRNGTYKTVLLAAVNSASVNLADHLFKFNRIEPEQQVVRNYYIKA